MKGLWGEEESKSTQLLASVVFPSAQEGISKSFVDADSPGTATPMLKGIHADGAKITARPRADLNLAKAGATPMEDIRPNAVAVWGGRKSLLQLFLLWNSAQKLMGKQHLLKPALETPQDVHRKPTLLDTRIHLYCCFFTGHLPDQGSA